MIVKSDPGPLIDHATEAFYPAAEDTLEYARVIAPVETGEFRDSLQMWKRKRPKGPTARIGSRLPQTSVLERGGGPAAGWQHRGPHIQRANAPATLRKAAAKFPGFYEQKLRSIPIRSTAIVVHEFAGEVGLPSLELGS